MAKIYETLRKKNDPTIEVYPNIESQNIPSGAVTETKIGTNAVTTGKLANNSVNSNKLADGAVTSNKLADGAVITNKIADNSIMYDKIADSAITTIKIQNSAVTTNKIDNGAVTSDKIDDNLWKWLQRVQSTYLVYVGDSDETMLSLLGTFTADKSFDNFTLSDYQSAFNFDKPLSSDYTETDLNILKLFIDRLYKSSLVGLGNYIIVNDFRVLMYKSGSTYRISLFQLSTNTNLFLLEFDSSDFSITSYTYNKYIYCNIVKLIDENTDYER